MTPPDNHKVREPGWHLNRTRSLADVWAMPGGTFLLSDEAGNFLHRNGQDLTTDEALAWRGTSSQLFKARRCLSAAAGLKPVRAS